MLEPISMLPALSWKIPEGDAPEEFAAIVLNSMREPSPSW